MKTLIVIPTYNEKENIEKLVFRIFNLRGNYNILFVDDNSPDGTGAIINKLAEKDKRVHIIHREKKMGIGKAYVDGFKYALKKDFEYIIQMDADFSHDPKYIPSFLEKIKEYDLVIGSRYCKGINVKNWSLFRRFLSIFASKYVKFFTRMPFHDTLGGFRCYRREVLECIDLDTIFSDGNVFLMEMLFIAYKKGYKITEIPIVYVYRESGHSKMSRKVIFEAFYKVPFIRMRHSGFNHKKDN